MNQLDREIIYDIRLQVGTQISHPSAHLATPKNPIGQPCAQNVYIIGQPDLRNESEARM